MCGEFVMFMLQNDKQYCCLVVYYRNRGRIFMYREIDKVDPSSKIVKLPLMSEKLMKFSIESNRRNFVKLQPVNIGFKPTNSMRALAMWHLTSLINNGWVLDRKEGCWDTLVDDAELSYINPICSPFQEVHAPRIPMYKAG